MTKSKISNTWPMAHATTARRITAASSVKSVAEMDWASGMASPVMNVLETIGGSRQTGYPGGWRASTEAKTSATLAPMIDKFVHSMADAMAGIENGSTVLLGGFGDVGIPTALLTGLIEQGARDLTIVVVAGGRDGSAIERLLSLGRVRKMICSFVRPASLAGRLLQRGELDVEIVPQGTMAERMRAAGAGITG